MAYASVASLMRTMESVLASKSPMKSLICDHRQKLLALHERLSSLELFLKNFEKTNVSGEMTVLEARINEVANVVERTIQLRLTEVVTTNDEMQKKKAHERLCDSLNQVTEDIDRVLKDSTKIQDKGKQASKESLSQDSSSENHIPYVENNMVGRGDERERILEELTRYHGSFGELKVIPIVGMGGIGKTTLAKEVFNDVTVQSHFDVRALATVSSHHNVKEILLSLLSSIKGDKFDMNDELGKKKDEPELADMLQKSLKGKRYLIVFDDIWKCEAWDDVRLCVPSESNGSRIMLTTRNNEVARYAAAESLSLQMSLMSPVESWNLFKSVGFANEELPSEFETIGKEIIDRCHGLPLTIVVVAGLLSKFERTVEAWEHIAEDLMSFVTNDPDEQCLHVLRLSYNHLTSDLKACLLYFGIYPEDSDISVNRLMRLWIAEGFLKLEKDLEGEAEKCLKDLIDRCLVLVSEKSLDETKVRSCKVHDLIYELCLREAQSQNIFIMNDIVEKTQSHDTVFDDEPNAVPPECHHLTSHVMQPCERWTDSDEIDHGSYRALLTPTHHHLIRRQADDEDNNLRNRTRSIFSFAHTSSAFSLKSELAHFKLVRILDLCPIDIDFFPSQILGLLWLRYLVLSGNFDLPPEIGKLWNLHTFINVEGYKKRNVTFPVQIWELMQLRQLRLHKFYLANPPRVSVDEERHWVFSNAHTISGLSPSSCTKEVISGIRNVKKLGIYGNTEDYEIFQESRLFDNLVHLHQLETLSFELKPLWLSNDKISPATIPNIKAFPATLKKLKLDSTGLRWEDLNIIGGLPNLEVLKLTWNACLDYEWYTIAGGFTRLKLLQIKSNLLKNWRATDDSFPALERLLIRHCLKLEEIPIEFSEINTLQLIELQGCNPNLEDSAARIQQEQEDIGNVPVHVRILQLYSDSGDDDDGSGSGSGS